MVKDGRGCLVMDVVLGGELGVVGVGWTLYVVVRGF